MSSGSPSSSERALWVAGTALLVGTVALLVAVALVAGDALGGDDGNTVAAAAVADPPTDNERQATDPDAVPVCRLLARRATLQPTGAAAAALESADIRLAPIPPARESSDGGFTFAVRDTVNLPCDVTAGVISLRGGLRVASGGRGIDLRRLRIDVRSRAVRMFMAPSGSPGFEGVGWTPSAPRIDTIRNRTRLRLPMDLTDAGALALNAALERPALFAGDEAFAVLEVELRPAPSNIQVDEPGP